MQLLAGDCPNTKTPARKIGIQYDIYPNKSRTTRAGPPFFEAAPCGKLLSGTTTQSVNANLKEYRRKRRAANQETLKGTPLALILLVLPSCKRSPRQLVEGAKLSHWSAPARRHHRFKWDLLAALRPSPITSSTRSGRLDVELLRQSGLWAWGHTQSTACGVRTRRLSSSRREGTVQVHGALLRATMVAGANLSPKAAEKCHSWWEESN